jgi:mannose-6-phosphate isomerase-like protein (cupin superfamily)
VALDPSGWERRILSPVLPGVEFEFMRTTLGPKVDAGVFLPHAHGSREYLAVGRGTLRLSIDGAEHLLRAGDSIYYRRRCAAWLRQSRVERVRVLSGHGRGEWEWMPWKMTGCGRSRKSAAWVIASWIRLPGPCEPAAAAGICAVSRGAGRADARVRSSGAWRERHEP